jgi:hypothetical protein
VVLVLALPIRGLLQGSNEIAQSDSMRQASKCWTTARQILPRTVPLYRPTWLPTVFQTARVGCSSELVDNQTVSHLAVTYEVGAQNRSFTIIADNTGVPVFPRLMRDFRPDWTIPIQVRGRAGQLLIQQADELRAFVWQAGKWRYNVEAQGGSLDELLQIVAGLQVI